MPGGVSAPISVKPLGVVSWECITRLASGASASPNSLKVLIVSSPPRAAW